MQPVELLKQIKALSVTDRLSLIETILQMTREELQQASQPAPPRPVQAGESPSMQVAGKELLRQYVEQRVARPRT